MKLDTTKWGFIAIEKLFRLESCKCSNAGALTSNDTKEKIFYIGAKKNENGVMREVDFNEKLVTKGNCIVFICDGQGSVGYSNYMDKDFIGSTTLTVGYNDKLNQYVGLFLVTILDLQRPKYSYGRKYKPHLKTTQIKLPMISEDEPDYEYMENYIKSLNYKTISTKVKPIDKKLNTSKWELFEVGELFDIKNGNNLELINCTTTYSKDAVNFVARTSQNNGVGAKVEPIDGVELIPAGTITCAVGGSVLSTFVQNKDFYTAFHIKLLYPKNKDMSLYAKLFCCVLIRENQYRYNYGRQANKTLPTLKIKLPCKKGRVIDYEFMENYIKSLSYSDKLL